MAISNTLQPTTVSDFSGGITDNYFSAKPNCSYVLDNFWLDENSKPYVRPGITCLTRLPYSLAAGRISGIYIGAIPFERPMFYVGVNAYYLDSSDVVQAVHNGASLTGKTNTDLDSSRIWQRQLISVSGPSVVVPNRIYCDTLSARSFQTLSLGLPALPSAPTLTSAGGTGSNFIYAFHYYYTFTDYLGTVYLEQGPHVQVEIDNVGAVNSDNITITAIPALTNTAYSNWILTTATKIRVFRTQSNGTTLYHVTDINSGTTSYVDSMDDATLTTQATIYTDGGVLDWDPPMVGSKYLTEVNDFFWYATDTTVTHSVQGAPGACPASYQQVVGQKIKGLASIIGFPILFCDQSVYRVDGTFDEFGNGGFELREISQTAGLVSNRAVVSIPGGLVFPGNGGFYFTDGYQVRQISNGVNNRYQLWNNPNMVGAYDPLKNLVTWAVTDSQNSSSFPNNFLVMLHLNFGLTDSSTFTTSSFTTNLFPTALAYTESQDVDVRFSSRLLFGTADAYFMYHDPLVYTDPNIDHEAFPAVWTRKAIIYRYESIGMNLGDEANRKYLVELTAEFYNDTDLAVNFISRRDDSGPWGTLSEIRSDGALLWGISEAAWNDPNDIDHDWNSQTVIEGKRHFPKGTLRSSRRQVGFTNSFTSIAKSDDQSVATVNATARTITLNDVTKTFPDYCEDYYIAFDVDGYVATYKIKTRNSDIAVTVYDPYATLTSNGSRKWQISGHRKNEVAKLLSYTVFSDLDGTTQAPNRGNASNVNA